MFFCPRRTSGKRTPRSRLPRDPNKKFHSAEENNFSPRRALDIGCTSYGITVIFFIPPSLCEVAVHPLSEFFFRHDQAIAHTDNRESFLVHQLVGRWRRHAQHLGDELRIEKQRKVIVTLVDWFFHFVYLLINFLGLRLCIWWRLKNIPSLIQGNKTDSCTPSGKIFSHFPWDFGRLSMRKIYPITF